MTSSFPTGIAMSEQVKYCGMAQPSWTMISPTDQCLIFSRSQRESQLISSNIKALSIQSACKPEKRTRSRARMSLDAQESTCVIAMAKTNENRTVMCWNIDQRSKRPTLNAERRPTSNSDAEQFSVFQNSAFQQGSILSLVTCHSSLSLELAL